MISMFHDHEPIHHSYILCKLNGTKNSLSQIALHSMSAIQKQQERTHKKIKVDPFKVSGGTDLTGSGSTLKPGDREDNAWFKYNTERIPDTQEKWESLVVVEKTHWGYYCWPR